MQNKGSMGVFELSRKIVTSLAVLCALLQVIDAQYPTDTSIVAGQTLWQGSPVATNPLGIPTLVYNCAKMPSICANVARRNPLDGNHVLTGGTISLTYDTVRSHTAERRSQQCPGTWKLTHPCPEVNQLPAIPQGEVLGGPRAIDNPRRLDESLPISSAGSYVIDAGDATSSGMMWTCDEWPPASVVEGGRDPQNPRDGTTCAPMATNCDREMNPVMRGTPTRSEQDFQAAAHALLRNKVGPNAKSTGLFTFSFRTEYNSALDSYAAYVEYYVIHGLKDHGYQKRQVESLNGTLYTRITKATTGMKADGKHYTLLYHTMENYPHAINESIPVSPGQKNPQNAPAIPLLQLSTDYILSQIQSTSNGSTIADTNGFLSTPKSLYTGKEKSSLNKRATGSDSADPIQCGAGNPCLDGSCCNKDGKCGFREYNCGANCTSNCNAQAMCGVDSPGGLKTCGLNLCCSYYGWCGVDEIHCGDPQPGDAPLPSSAQTDCQEGFGLCKVITPPTCSASGGSASKGRKVAYYQSWNVRDRACNRITISEINTTGITHLYFAFLNIDPASFMITPRDPADTSLYAEFSALKTAVMQTWIAVGGFDFSNVGPTRTTWSDMCSTSANRATFIESLILFMAEYGFQGVDLDWEYPATADRGGKEADTTNFVSLVTEMRAAFGTKYGISLTLAPDYWYLRGFDPKAMESSVDFFGFMSYDLHGSWDADVKTLGSLVRPQTDIREIANDSVPLFFDNLDPAKINIGLAFYGRGYTLASSSCAYFGCPFIGPSNPMPCTAFAGVASNTEIKNIIAQKSLQPELILDAMVKQITWDDQWIGYDDDDTFALKLSWADSHCFGGTMIWSIDMDSGSGSGNTPDGGDTGDNDPGGNGGEGSDAGASEGGQENGGSTNGGPKSSDGSAGPNNETVPNIYIDPSIWMERNPVVMCDPPCQLILPPFPLQEGGVTITPGSLTTTMDVENNIAFTTVVSGVEQVHNQILESILTTTIPVSPLTVTQMGFYGLNITGTKGTSALITATASIEIPVFALTETVTRDQGGSSTSSSPIVVYVTPPPYPWTIGDSDKPSPPGPPPPGPPPPALPHIPVITFKPGNPGPICKSGCGTPCLVFCPDCGFFGCGGCGLFGCGNDNSVIESGDTDNTDGNDPDGDESGEDEDEQDEAQDECLLEIGGGQGDGNSAIGPAVTSFTNSNPPKPSFQSIPPLPSQVSIASAPPPPKPSPPPPPEPPLPNPDTETLKCYKKGSVIGRGTAIALLNDFCGPKYWGGTTISNNRYVRFDGVVEEQFVDVIISVQGLNNCEFTIDGPNADQDCGRILREIIDKCDQSSTRYKKGGTVTSNCAIWRMDPGFIPVKFTEPHGGLLDNFGYSS